MWLAAALLALAAGAAPDPNLGYRLKSRCWLPYESDAEALGIFHLDSNRKLDDGALDGALDDLLDEGQADMPKDNVGDAADAGANVPDSSVSRRPASAAGKFEWSTDGRFGGGLRLEGAKAVLATPTYAKLTETTACTVEAWFKPANDKEATLFALDGKVMAEPAFELRRLAGGGLKALVAGKSVGAVESGLPAGEWRHVALIVTGKHEHKGFHSKESFEPQLRLAIDGATIASFETKRAAGYLKRLTGRVRVGNRQEGGAPFAGLVDEVRVSTGVREFYLLDPGWAAKDAPPVVDHQPYLRDRRDLRLHLPFDGSLAPAAAGAAQFVPGLRGQAVMLGPGLALPAYAADGKVEWQSGTLEFWFRPWNWDNRRVQSFHDPMEFVPLLAVTQVKGGESSDFLALGFLHKRPRGKRALFPLRPGAWYHVACTWEGRRKAVYLNGALLQQEAAYFRVAKPKTDARLGRLVFEPRPGTKGMYKPKQTLVDEFRLYGRALTPPEIANAYERYRPLPQLARLPFAHVQLGLNTPARYMDLAVELLGERRDEVVTVKASLLGPDGREVFPGVTVAPLDGRAATRAKKAPVGYGKHELKIDFLDGAGRQVERMTIARDRVKPPWLGSKVGLHPDKVLPGWTPMAVDDNGGIKLIGRELQIAGSGWPAGIRSNGEQMLAAPVGVVLKANGQEIELQPMARPTIVKANDAMVETRGAVSGAGWQLATTIETQFDGMMKVTSNLSAPAGAEVEELRLEIPLASERAIFLGMWTGGRNFRGTTRYGLLPDKDGVLFSSNRPGRRKNAKVRGSFIPYLFLGDDDRGLTWFAENDKGWTKSMEKAAIEVERRGDRTVLRLNLITAKTVLAGPRTFVFGLQPTPVRPLDPAHRKKAGSLNFGFVDCFSKQGLKTDEPSISMIIYPDDYDWEAAARRAAVHAEAYRGMYGYKKAYLYVDRNWVGTPPDSLEHRPKWWRSGFYRYLPEAANCYLWNMDQWLQRGLIEGIYIDDIWIGTFTDPETGPAYLLADGAVQAGFEFFDYHEFLKRLRWAFVDRGLPPNIWVHATDTPYTPIVSFAEYMLDGEGRFVPWGQKRDFMSSFAMGRIRYANGEKLGLTPVWMNKIGNDLPKPMPMPHWTFRQARSYCGVLLLHDINSVADIGKMGRLRQLFAEEASIFRFRGYWRRDNPFRFEDPKVFASIYQAKEKTFVVIANYNHEAANHAAAIDFERLGIAGLTSDNLVIRDIDPYDMPEGEDFTKGQKATIAAPDEKDGGELADMFEEALADEAKEDKRREGGVVLDAHNFLWRDGKLTLRVRGRDFRLLELRRK